jgi:hypothetical protein
MAISFLEEADLKRLNLGPLMGSRTYKLERGYEVQYWDAGISTSHMIVYDGPKRYRIVATTQRDDESRSMHVINSQRFGGNFGLTREAEQEFYLMAKEAYESGLLAEDKFVERAELINTPFNEYLGSKTDVSPISPFSVFAAMNAATLSMVGYIAATFSGIRVDSDFALYTGAVFSGAVGICMDIGLQRGNKRRVRMLAEAEAGNMKADYEGLERILETVRANTNRP